MPDQLHLTFDDQLRQLLKTLQENAPPTAKQAALEAFPPLPQLEFERSLGWEERSGAKQRNERRITQWHLLVKAWVYSCGGDDAACREARRLALGLSNPQISPDAP